MTRAKERTQKLNELIVGAVLHAVLAHLYSRLVLWPEPLQRLKHDNLLCGWASDEHSKVSSWTVSVAWKYFSTSLQRKSLSHHFEVVFNSLNAFPLIASKWQQLHGNWMGSSIRKGIIRRKTQQSANGKQTSHTKIDCDYDLFAAISHSEKFDIPLWIIILRDALSERRATPGEATARRSHQATKHKIEYSTWCLTGL